MERIAGNKAHLVGTRRRFYLVIMKPLDLPQVPLPKYWNEHIKHSLLACFTLAHYSLIHLRAWAHNVSHPVVRREIRIEQLENEIALLREHIRLLQARLEKIPPKQRSHYSPLDRFAILGFKEARGWSYSRVAREFLVSPRTIAKWFALLRCDSLVQAIAEPVNKFPDFVTALVQETKTKFPLLGTRQIADWLARGGLHLSRSFVRRALKKPILRPPRRSPLRASSQKATLPEPLAKKPHDIWHADITTVPMDFGLAMSWWPHSFPPLFPSAVKVVAVIDSFTKKVLAIRCFKREPSADDVVSTLDAAVKAASTAPRHLITDKGTQFCNRRQNSPTAAMKSWLDRHKTRIRFGAVGRKGSIAIIERFFRTLKQEGTRRMLMPYRIEEIDVELDVFSQWYNERRPHSALAGRSPEQMINREPPPSDCPRFEVRPRYPVAHQDIAAGQVWRARHVSLKAEYFKRRKHLPDIMLDVAA